MKKTLLTTFVLFMTVMMSFAAVVNDSIYVQKVDFESGEIPEGWTQEYVGSDIYGEHPWVIEEAEKAEYPAAVKDNGNYLLALRNNSTATIGYTTRLISPVMDLSQNKVFQPILVFSHAQQQRTGDFDQLKVYYRSKTTDNWVRLDGRNGNPEFNQKIAKWQRDTIQLTSQSDTYQIMFEVTDRFGRGVVLDNIEVRPMPTCEDPHGYVVSGLTTSAATVSWNASFDTDSFEVALTTSAVESMESIDPADVVYYGFLTDDEFAFSSEKVGLVLKRNQLYYLYVRSYCQGALSEWTYTSFRTKNFASLPLIQNFTAGEDFEYKSGSVSHISYWSFGTSIKREDGVTMEFMPFVNTLTQPGTATAGYYAFDQSFCLAFTGARSLSTDIPAGQFVYAATPELNVPSLQNVFVSFWGTAYQSVGPDYASGIIVGVMTDPEDFTTFVPVDTCYISNSKEFNKFGVSLASYQGEGKYVAFASDFKDKNNRFYMDNILIKASVAPIWPENITVSKKTPKSFELSLDSHGYNYNVVVTKHVTDNIGKVLTEPSTNEGDVLLTLNNQSAQTQIITLPEGVGGQFVEVYIQSVSAEGASDWALPVKVLLPKHLSVAEMPLVIDFEGEKFWSPSMLSEFSQTYTGSQKYPMEVEVIPSKYVEAGALKYQWPSVQGTSSTLTDYAKGKNASWFYKEYQIETSVGFGYDWKLDHGAYFALPEVDDVKQVVLSFHMHDYNAYDISAVAVGVMTDPYDYTTFDTLAVYCAKTPTHKKYTHTFTDYKGNGKYIAIMAVENPEGKTRKGSSGSSTAGYSYEQYYVSMQVLDGIILEAAGECIPAGVPTITPADSTAEMTWARSNMTQWVVMLKDAKDNLLDSLVVDTNYYAAKNLMPHTDYSFYVASACDSIGGQWFDFSTECAPAEPLPFVEDFESLDYKTGSSSGFIPYCWSSPRYVYNGGGSGEPNSYYPYIYRSTSTGGHSSNSSLYLYTNSSSTVQNQIWAALPALADSINKLQVEFFVKGYSVSQNSMLQVGIMTDPNDITTFEVVDSVNVVGTAWKGVLIKLDKYAGEGKYIAFKRNYERDGKANYYLDDIAVDYIKDCEKLFSLSTSEPTTNGAKFSWNKTNADKYEVLVLTENINPNSADTTGKVISVEETDTTVLVYRNDALELNKIYYAYVRTVCGAAPTTWSEGASFRTTCLPETPDAYGVETFTEATVLGCWTVGVLSGTTNAPSRNGSATSKFGWYMRIFNTAASDGAYAIMPPLDVEDISKYQITFDACTNSTTAGNVKSITVGIISNASDLSTFAPVTTITGLNYTTDSTGMFTYTIPFDSYDGDYVTGAKGTQVMFLSESGDNYNEAYIDNIRFALIPSCAAPSTIAVDSLSDTAAKFSWNKTGLSYELAVTTTKVAPSAENAQVVKTVENIMDTTAVVEGLTMLTDYYVYIRTICGGGDTSAWSNARAFRTTCPESYALPFAEGFESYTTTTGNRKPDCWTCYYLNGTTVTEGTGASYPSLGTTASYAHASTRYIYMYSSGASTKTYSFAAMPYIDTDLTKTMISFWYRSNSAGTSSAPNRKVVVGIAEEVSTLDTLMATFQPIDTVISTLATYEKYTRIVSEKYNGKGHYFVIIGIDGNGATSSGGMYVDDIEISLVPSCFLPDNLNAGNMYDTSAKLTWEQLQGDNTAWDVAYGLAGTAVADMTVVAADTTELVINGLQPSTTYDFYVRANCGDEYSDWRGPVTATTLYQIPLADAQWTFENNEPTKPYIAGQTNKAPQSWFVYNYVTGVGTVGNVPYIQANTKNATTGLVTSRYALSGDSVMRIYGSGSYVVLPVIANENYDDLQVRFNARSLYVTPSKVNDQVDSIYSTTYCYNASYARTIRVGVASDPYDMSTFEEMTAYVLPQVGTSTSTKVSAAPDPEDASWWREVVVPLYGAKGKYIVFASPAMQNVVYVDNVVIEKVDPNACANVTKLALDEDALKYNTAEFDWLSPKKSFKVTITEKDAAEAYATTIVDTAYFKIDSLQAQTTYTISVQAVCGEDLSKAVTLTFTTPCKPAEEAEASWGFTENLYQWGTSNTYMIPECWDEGLGAGSGASYTPYAIINPTAAAASICYSRGDTVGGRALQFYTTTSNYNAYAVLPELGFPVDSMTLHFWGRAARFNSSRATNTSNKSKLNAANGNYLRTLVVGVMADPADFSTFVPMDTITYDQKWTATAGIFAYDDPLGNNYWQEYALPLAKYQGKGRIAIMAPKPTATSYFYLDDVEIVKGDFCTPTTGQKAEEVMATTAIIRWTEMVINPYVQLQVATDEDFEKLVYDQQLDSVNSVALENLKPATEYFFRLKHLCDTVAGDESEWSATGSFFTDYVVRFSENFNDVKTNLPKNWWRSNTATAEEVFSGEKTLTEASETASYDWRTSVGNNQYIYANLTTNNASSSTSSAKHWLISPEIDLTANAEDSLLLSFDVALRSQASDIPNPNTDVLEQLIVVVSTDDGKTWSADNAVVWSTDVEGDYYFNNFYANGKFITKYIDFTKYAGQSIRIAFYIYSFADKQVAGSKNFVLLDNIQLNKYMLTENSAKICRWEDYAGYGFDLDADQLPAGTNMFERFTRANKDAEKDLIERLTVVVEDETVNELEAVTLCEGTSYKGDGFEFIADQTGVYKQKLQSGIGCDSTVILYVTVNPKMYNDIEETICQGAYYEFDGEKYYTSTNVTKTFTSVLGCDSIVTLHLTVNEILKGETEQVYLCPGASYYFTEKYPELTEAGLYEDTLLTLKGCDSVASVEIFNVPEAYTFIRAAICQGETYTEGVFVGLRNPGDYSTPHGPEGLHTIYGCDSIVTLHLLVAQPTEEQTFVLEDTVSVANLPYILNGEELLPAGTPDGIYPQTITLGCGDATLTILVGTAQGIDAVNASEKVARKLFYNGHIYIICNDEWYNAEGKKVNDPSK